MTNDTWISEAIAQRRLQGLLSPVHPGDRRTATEWFGRIEPTSYAPSSNVEAQALPFQRWYRFKEAFSPRFVSSAIGAIERRPRVCVDPFGGSGTTALTCQFLGVHPATMEVNPFLADLIEAKLTRYDVSSLIRSYTEVLKESRAIRIEPQRVLDGAPPTFVEPGVDGRWIFDRPVAKKLLALRAAVLQLSDPAHQRLFRVLLGSIAVRLSNVLISGKGRRYRSGWETRSETAQSVERAFRDTAEKAIEDVTRFGRRAERGFTLLRGDARDLIHKSPPAEFSLFSPPYPNSFDYTDIYNVELWLLGYLTSSQDNKSLRNSTLRSHVQVKRSYEGEVPESKLLKKIVRDLTRKAEELWDPYIPAMVRAYFADMAAILGGLDATMTRKADVMMVIGDSRYAGVRVDVASILAEMAPALSFRVISLRPIRAMRASAQQGGHHILSETLLHIKRIR
jgi:hypothetical protein